MLSYIGLAVMVVGAIVVFIDFEERKAPPIEVHAPVPDKRIDALINSVAQLSIACDAAPLKVALEQLSNRQSAMELAFKHQKVPHFPSKIEVSIADPVAVSLTTPRPIKVVHREAMTAKITGNAVEKIKKVLKK